MFPKQYHQLIVYHFFKQMKICLFVVGKTNKNLTIFIFHKFFKAFLFKCQVISGICFIYLNTIGSLVISREVFFELFSIAILLAVFYNVGRPSLVEAPICLKPGRVRTIYHLTIPVAC